MKKKFQNPEWKKMYEVLKAVIFKTEGRGILAAVLFNVLASVLNTVSIFPIMGFAPAENSFSISFVVSLVMFVVCIFLINILLCGLIKISTDYTLSFPTSLKEIFYGFKSKNKNIIFISLIFTALFFIAAAITFFVTLSLKGFIGPELMDLFLGEGNIQEKLMSGKLLYIFYFLYFLFLILLCIFYLPFIFTVNAAIQNPEANFLDALKKNFTVGFFRYFHFVGFALYVCYKNFIALIISLMLSSLTPFLGFFAGLFAMIQIYVIYSKIFMSIPVYYFSFLSVNNLVPKKDETNLDNEEKKESEIFIEENSNEDSDE